MLGNVSDAIGILALYGAIPTDNGIEYKGRKYPFTSDVCELLSILKEQHNED